MNKKSQGLVEPGTRMYLIIMGIFSVVSYFFHPWLSAAEIVIVLVLIIHSNISSQRNQRKLLEYIESITYDVESAKNNSLMNFPLPMVVYSLEDYRVIWGNNQFFEICDKKPSSFDLRLNDLVLDFHSKWLYEGKNTAPGVMELQNRKFQVYGNIVRGGAPNEQDFMGIAYWLDVTDLVIIKGEFELSRPIVAIIVLDNYDELLKNLSDRERNTMRSAVEDKINSWCDGKGGIVRRYDRDRYLFIFEARFLDEYIEKRFPILDQVREIVNPSGIHATVSIGIGKDGATLEESYSFAALSIEMALSRGGDQAVIKNRFNFEFFGGRGSEIETRTKVKSRVMANAISGLISDASQVFVMGHKFADLDSLGAAVGVCCIARTLGSNVHIVINMSKNACGALLEDLMTVPEYNGVFISPDEALLLADNRSLLVVVDTNRPEQVEDETLLTACNKVVVIDHHRRAATYIQNAALTLYEPYASSVCELMTELLQELVEQSSILPMESVAMMSGIVMDTKNFTIRTGERTFDAAAFLRRAGADTSEIKIYMQNDIDHAVQKYGLLQGAKIYKGEIAIAAPDTFQDRVVAAQAADELLNICGVTASIVTYPTPDGGVIISARSIGHINVQVLMEAFGGGGNKSAAGAQLSNANFKDTVEDIFKTIDDYLSSTN